MPLKAHSQPVLSAPEPLCSEPSHGPPTAMPNARLSGRRFLRYKRRRCNPLRPQYDKWLVRGQLRHNRRCGPSSITVPTQSKTVSIAKDRWLPSFAIFAPPSLSRSSRVRPERSSLRRHEALARALHAQIPTSTWPASTTPSTPLSPRSRARSRPCARRRSAASPSICECPARTESGAHSRSAPPRAAPVLPPCVLVVLAHVLL